MKTAIKQISLSAIVLFSTVIIFSSFKSAGGNSHAKGSGIADGIQFNFSVVKQSNGNVTGHVQYRGSFHPVESADWFDNTVIIYTADGLAFLVADNGSLTDWITDPIPASPFNRFWPSDFFGIHNVTTGYIQVKE